MFLTSDSTVHTYMLSSIFKGPNSSGSTPKRVSATQATETSSQNPHPSNDGERSVSADSGLSLSKSLQVKLDVVTNSFELPPPPTNEYVQKTKKTAGYLRLLLHSRKCNGNCMKTPCIKTSNVVEHMRVCFDNRCAYPGCSTSKKLIDHYEKCGLNSVAHTPTTRSPTGHPLFCLLCSLVPQATTSPTHRMHYLSPDQSLYSGPSVDEHEHDPYGDIVYNDHRRSLEAMVDHNSESPIIFDEVMQFSKVPFQDAPPEYFRHTMTSIAVHGLVDHAAEEPPRKIRSKSMNVVGSSDIWGT
jgi:hypothetical protein